MSARPGVFLDRDGVLSELVADPETGLGEAPLRVADVRLVPGAADAVAALSAAGYVLVVVTNQPSAAKAKTTVEELLAIQERVRELLLAEGAHLDGWRMCLHHPDGVLSELTGACECRKPAPGMLLDTAAELDIDLTRSWMCGDTDTDMLAGRAAGCRTLLIEHPASLHKRSKENYDLLARDLWDATAQLLALERVSR